MPFVPRKASPDDLMPGGRLTISIKIKILPSPFTMFHTGLQSTKSPSSSVLTAVAARGPSVNIRGRMLDSWVEVGAGSVRLRFAGGEQMCHTFPLAARYRFLLPSSKL